MEKEFKDEATALAAKMFQSLPPGTHSNALILALQSMLGAVIGRTAHDVDNMELYSDIAEELHKTAVFVRNKHGAFD